MDSDTARMMQRQSSIARARRRREQGEMIERKRLALIDVLARDDQDERARLMTMPYWEIVCEKNGPERMLPGLREPNPEVGSDRLEQP